MISLKGGVTASLDDTMAVDIMRTMLYSLDGARLLPRFIHQLSTNDSGVSDILEIVRKQDQSVSTGLYLSVACREMDRSGMIAEGSTNAVRARIIQSSLATKALARLCQAWGQEYEPATSAPISSAIPTLILAGENDPVIPVSWSGEAAMGLTRAQVLIFVREGHAPGTAACGTLAVGKFFDDPETSVSLPCASLVHPYRFVTQ
jgi:pimeloyl-ACP methyl ester carboxylesterase